MMPCLCKRAEWEDDAVFCVKEQNGTMGGS